MTEPLFTLDCARTLLSGHVQPLPAVEIDSVNSMGLRLFETVAAAFALPPEDVSAMDGYAVRSGELSPNPFPVSVSVRAGMPQVELPHQTVARIQTGAVIPAGADAVVAQEQAFAEADGRIRLPVAKRGQFIRRAGEIRSMGQPLAEAGQMVTPQLLGLLVAAGPLKLRAIPRPRLTILTTGSELVGAVECPGQGKIRDSNAWVLQALAQEARLRAVVRDRIPDSPEALLNAISSATEGADLMVTSGGVSVGDYDLIRSVIEGLGGETLFHRVAIRPGKPTLVAKLGRSWIVGLPGNPLSALAGWHLFAKPLAERLAGDPRAFDWSPGEAVLAEAASNPSDRTTFAPAIIDQTSHPHIQLLPWKGSHDLYSVCVANALAILPPGLQASPREAVQFLRV